jgi:hypothetical protein
VIDDREEEIRERLRRALPGRLKRFHWRDDRDLVRERALAIMRTADLAGLTVYRSRVGTRASERVRQHGLWNLVAWLRDRNVDDVLFEARERGQTAKDEATLHQISRSSVSSNDFRYAFIRPFDEPLVWLPDYLAGAYGESLRTGGTDRYVETLPEALSSTNFRHCRSKRKAQVPISIGGPGPSSCRTAAGTKNGTRPRAARQESPGQRGPRAAGCPVHRAWEHLFGHVAPGLYAAPRRWLLADEVDRR